MGNKLVKSLVNAPLPQMVENMGMSIARAQRALDMTSIALAQELTTTMVEFGEGRTRSLLSLGFTPTFYAFTETTIEAKVAFSMKEETEIGVSASVSGGIGVFAASVEASYSRKFSFEASGSSAIATRLVTVPPPQVFLEYIERLAQEDAAAQEEEDEEPVAPV